MGYKMIELTQGRETKVDPEDYEWLNQHKWYYVHWGYAVRKSYVTGRSVLLHMHRVILEYHGTNMTGVKTDHKNRDGLDNRKTNLRISTHAQNMRNRKKQRNNKSGYIGVCLPTGYTKWKAAIRVNSKTIHLGLHSDIIEAAKAYDKAALRYHGEFAVTNFHGKSSQQKETE